MNQTDVTGGTPATATTAESRLLTAVEIASVLGVKPSWVYAQARAKRIPHVRLGRYTRFRANSILEWALDHEEGPVPPRGEAPRRSQP